MPRLKNFLHRVRARYGNRKGQTLVEYALVLAMVTVCMVGVYTLLDARLVAIFSAMTDLLDTAQSST
ncbi:MAG: hypothetical protein LV479_12555 [Methylacidiphilales bacterium]|nr:hypothetical protein [Candidatus Methylacidiphilales bacterium]